MLPTVRSCLRFLWCCALGLAVFSLSGCGVQGVFFHPDKTLYSTPADLGLRFEDVRFRSKDGTLLTAWFIPAAGYTNPRDAKGTVVHFHGNAQNMSAHWQYVAWLPRRGYNVLVFDYRGYGASAGKPDVKGVFEDSASALDYVRSRPDVNPERLLVLGQSLGGTNAIAVVGSGNRAGVKAVAIEATFYSYGSIAGDKITGAGLLMDDTYSAANFVHQLSPLPLLLIHGTDDPVIPYAHALRLMDRAQEPKTLITVPGGHHIDAFTPRFGTTYQEQVLDFFDKAVGLVPVLAGKS